MGAAIETDRIGDARDGDAGKVERSKYVSKRGLQKVVENGNGHKNTSPEHPRLPTEFNQIKSNEKSWPWAPWAG